MFYISSSSGALTPFDPRTGSISIAAGPIEKAAEVLNVSELKIIQGVEKVELLRDVSEVVATNATIDSLNQIEDASIYEGSVLPTTRELTGLTDTLNIGRAGAAMAYRVQEMEFEPELQPTELIPKVGAVQNSAVINDDAGESRERVNPIKRSNYRSSPPAKERKQVVAAIDIMSSPVFSLREEMPIEEAEKVFKSKKFRHIPIVSANGNLVGIVSDRDFIGPMSPSGAGVTLIKERMVTNILTARPQTEIRSIAEVMIDHHIGCLPIVEENGALVGILTRSDILRAIVNHAPIELWT